VSDLSAWLAAARELGDAGACARTREGAGGRCMMRQCNARTRGGGRCGNAPVPGHWRCRLHGGLSSGPRHLTTDATAARIFRMQRGRLRWLASLRAAGLKVPCGRKACGSRPRSQYRLAAKAQKAIEERMAVMTKKKTAPPPALPQGTAPAPTEPVTPAGGPVALPKKSKGERLSDLTDLGLEQARIILGADIDPNDRSPSALKQMSIVANVALQIIGQQARLDEAALRASRDNFDYGEFYRSFGSAAEPGIDNEHDE
jgi:hypothetical protein